MALEKDGKVKRSMPRFPAIDGLRAWLAWLVVLSHVVQQAGLQDAGRAWHAIFDSGNWAVRVFIMISGFVITHLLIERREPYRAYIVRRFMRLYPCFLVCFLLGALAYWGAARIGDRTWFAANNSILFEAQSQHFWANMLAHLTMVHGIIPNDILVRSEYAFLPPGWSVSLEWQFYIIAPLVLFSLSSLKRLSITAIAVMGIGFSYNQWLAIHWLQPSIIFGMAQYFFFGILTRSAIEGRHGNFRLPLGLVVCVMLSGGLFLFTDHSIGIWLLLLSFMMTDPKDLTGLELRYYRFLHQAFEGRIVKFLAQRSYSTYLLHYPILLMVGAVGTRYLHISSGARLVPFLLLAVPITFVLQEPLYRWVELPGQTYGRRWACMLGERPMAEIPVEVV